MAIDRDRIIELLGTGLTGEVVAQTVGCDPSSITHMWADEEFKSKVLALRAIKLKANTERDERINGLEDKLIDRLENAIDTYQITKPGDILKSFAVINAAKRRGIEINGSVAPIQTVVSLTIPVQVLQQFIANPKNEVIEIDGKTMVTMPAAQLLANLADKSKNDERYTQIQKRLPGAIEHGSSNS